VWWIDRKKKKLHFFDQINDIVALSTISGNIFVASFIPESWHRGCCTSIQLMD